MKILIAGLVKNIQLQRLQVEGSIRGHIVEGCYASDLIIMAENGKFEANIKGKKLNEYDLIYMIVGKRRWEWYTAAYFLNKNFGTLIVNNKIVDPNYNYFLTPALDYLKQSENTLPFPKSAVVFNPKEIDSVLEEFHLPVIVKTSIGRQGRGVYLAKSRDEVKKAAKAILATNTYSFIIREFIPNDGDIRVFIVGGKAIGAMKRIPKTGEFRSNISQGGNGEKFDLEIYPNVKELAEKAAQITKTEIAGVDIIINKETGELYILEVNPAPQFEGLERYTGVNVAVTIIEYFESLKKSN